MSNKQQRIKEYLKKAEKNKELRKKLEVLHTKEGKLNYLEELERKIGIVEKPTKKTFYEELAKFRNLKVENKMDGVDFYKNFSPNDKIGRAEEKLAKIKKVKEAWEKAGMQSRIKVLKKEVKKQKLKLADLKAKSKYKDQIQEAKKLYQQLGLEEEKITKKIGKQQEKAKHFISAAKRYAKVWTDKMTKEMYEKGADRIVRKNKALTEEVIEYYKRAGLSQEKMYFSAADALVKGFFIEEAILLYKKAYNSKELKKRFMYPRIASICKEEGNYSLAKKYFEKDNHKQRWFEEDTGIWKETMREKVADVYERTNEARKARILRMKNKKTGLGEITQEDIDILFNSNVIRK